MHVENLGHPQPPARFKAPSDLLERTSELDDIAVTPHTHLSPATGQQSLLTDRQILLLDTAVGMELGTGPGDSLNYAARLWAQLSLPYRDPGSTDEWVRRNGAITLRISPGMVTAKDGTRTRAYPYGVIPRYLLTWMTTEAVRTRSRTLHLGDSLAQFLAKLGMNSSGASGRRMIDQLRRLTVSTLNIEDIRHEDERWGVSGANFSVTSRYDLWFSRNDHDGQQPLLGSTITLSEDFYRSVIEAPVPVKPEALRALSGSPMRLDLYTWLVYRLSYLQRASTVSWNQLANQFGSEYAVQRQFKAAFEKNLREVLILYPQAKLTVTNTGLRLMPSHPHILPKATGT